MLVKIAKVLGVRDLADLTGDQSMPVAEFTGPGHPALSAVRAAVYTPLFAVDGRTSDVAELRMRLAEGWRVRHRSPNHRTALGGLLPDLISDAQAAVMALEGQARRDAYAVLAEVMNLCQMFAAYQPDGSLLWRIAERGMMAAQESGDRAVIASAAWFLGQAHRDAGQWDDAAAVVNSALLLLETTLPDADTEHLSMYGALCFEAAYTHARSGEAGHAWRMWDRAEEVAQQLPASHYHRQTSFSRAIIGAHGVTTAVELAQPGTALRYAHRLDPNMIPSAPRRARHLIEVARAEHSRAEHASTVATLQAAWDSAPETFRYNGYARRMTAELLDGPAWVRDDARRLATTVGLAE